MSMLRSISKQTLLTWFITFLISILGTVQLNQKKSYGGDYLAYWLTSYQLSQGESFSDRQGLLEAKKEIAPTYDGPVDTWNPPWAYPLFIPFTLLTFDTARLLWLSLLFASLLLSVQAVWHIQAQNKEAWLTKFLLLICATLCYPATIWLFSYEQISILLLIGLVGFLSLQKTHPIISGCFLALTTIKPHIVFLLLPILLLELLFNRRYKILFSFTGILCVLMGITLFLRPVFITEYFSKVEGGPLLELLTPSLPVMFGMWFDLLSLRFIGLALLPILVYAWHRTRRQKDLDLFNLVVWLLFASIIFAPYGFGFDFIVLLLPWWQMFIWLSDDLLSPFISRILLIMISVGTISSFVFMSFQLHHVYAFWIPLYTCIMYGFIYYARWYIPHSPQA